MPNPVQHSSSEGFAFFKFAHFASRAYSLQPQASSLTEHPGASATEHQPVAGSKGGQRPPGARWQDKAAPKTAPLGSAQPAPGRKDERRGLLDTPRVRSPHYPDAKERKERATIRLRPGVKSSLLRQASLDGVSLAAVCDLGLEAYARQTIHEQEEALFEPRMRTMMRQENRAFGDRLVPFIMRIAIAAEQTRLIEADLYKRHLRQEGVPILKIQAKLKSMYHQARANVLKKTPQMKTILEQWWQEAPDGEANACEEREEGVAEPWPS